MKSHCLSIALMLMAGLTVGAVDWSARLAHGATVYAEIFPNTTDFAISLEQAGWQFHQGASATLGGFPAGNISSEPNIPIVAPINSFPSDPTEVEGYIAMEVSLIQSGVPLLIWTSEYTIPDGIPLSKVEWHSYSGNDNSIDVTNFFALQVAGNWYVTDQSGANIGAAPDGGQFNELNLTTATWKSLGFTPGSTLALGGATALPSGDITAFGFFEDSFELTLRYDNFTITSVPEPSSFIFLWIGAMALALFRRRAVNCRL